MPTELTQWEISLGVTIFYRGGSMANVARLKIFFEGECEAATQRRSHEGFAVASVEMSASSEKNRETMASAGDLSEKIQSTESLVDESASTETATEINSKIGVEEIVAAEQLRTDITNGDNDVKVLLAEKSIDATSKFSLAEASVKKMTEISVVPTEEKKLIVDVKMSTVELAASSELPVAMPKHIEDPENSLNIKVEKSGSVNGKTGEIELTISSKQPAADSTNASWSEKAAMFEIEEAALSKEQLTNSPLADKGLLVDEKKQEIVLSVAEPKDITVAKSPEIKTDESDAVGNSRTTDVALAASSNLLAAQSKDTPKVEASVPVETEKLVSVDNKSEVQAKTKDTTKVEQSSTNQTNVSSAIDEKTTAVELSAPSEVASKIEKSAPVEIDKTASVEEKPVDELVTLPELSAAGLKDTQKLDGIDKTASVVEKPIANPTVSSELPEAVPKDATKQEETLAIEGDELAAEVSTDAKAIKLETAETKKMVPVKEELTNSPSITNKPDDLKRLETELSTAQTNDTAKPELTSASKTNESDAADKSVSVDKKIIGDMATPSDLPVEEPKGTAKVVNSELTAANPNNNVILEELLATKSDESVVPKDATKHEETFSIENDELAAEVSMDAKAIKLETAETEKIGLVKEELKNTPSTTKKPDDLKKPEIEQSTTQTKDIAKPELMATKNDDSVAVIDGKSTEDSSGSSKAETFGSVENKKVVPGKEPPTNVPRTDIEPVIVEKPKIEMAVTSKLAAVETKDNTKLENSSPTIIVETGDEANDKTAEIESDAPQLPSSPVPQLPVTESKDSFKAQYSVSVEALKLAPIDKISIDAASEQSASEPKDAANAEKSLPNKTNDSDSAISAIMTDVELTAPEPAHTSQLSTEAKDITMIEKSSPSQIDESGAIIDEKNPEIKSTEIDLVDTVKPEISVVDMKKSEIEPVGTSEPLTAEPKSSTGKTDDSDSAVDAKTAEVGMKPIIQSAAPSELLVADSIDLLKDKGTVPEKEQQSNIPLADITLVVEVEKKVASAFELSSTKAKDVTEVDKSSVGKTDVSDAVIDGIGLSASSKVSVRASKDTLKAEESVIQEAKSEIEQAAVEPKNVTAVKSPTSKTDESGTEVNAEKTQEGMRPNVCLTTHSEASLEDSTNVLKAEKMVSVETEIAVPLKEQPIDIPSAVKITFDDVKKPGNELSDAETKDILKEEKSSATAALNQIELAFPSSKTDESISVETEEAMPINELNIELPADKKPAFDVKRPEVLLASTTQPSAAQPKDIATVEIPITSESDESRSVINEKITEAKLMSPSKSSAEDPVDISKIESVESDKTISVNEKPIAELAISANLSVTFSTDVSNAKKLVEAETEKEVPVKDIPSAEEISVVEGGKFDRDLSEVETKDISMVEKSASTRTDGLGAVINEIDLGAPSKLSVVDSTTAIKDESFVSAETEKKPPDNVKKPEIALAITSEQAATRKTYESDSVIQSKDTSKMEISVPAEGDKTSFVDEIPIVQLAESSDGQVPVGDHGETYEIDLTDSVDIHSADDKPAIDVKKPEVEPADTSKPLASEPEDMTPVINSSTSKTKESHSVTDGYTTDDKVAVPLELSAEGSKDTCNAESVADKIDTTVSEHEKSTTELAASSELSAAEPQDGMKLEISETSAVVEFVVPSKLSEADLKNAIKAEKTQPVVAALSDNTDLKDVTNVVDEKEPEIELPDTCEESTAKQIHITKVEESSAAETEKSDSAVHEKKTKVELEVFPKPSEVESVATSEAEKSVPLETDEPASVNNEAIIMVAAIPEKERKDTLEDKKPSVSKTDESDSSINAKPAEIELAAPVEFSAVESKENSKTEESVLVEMDQTVNADNGAIGDLGRAILTVAAIPEKEQKDTLEEKYPSVNKSDESVSPINAKPAEIESPAVESKDNSKTEESVLVEMDQTVNADNEAIGKLSAPSELSAAEPKETINLVISLTTENTGLGVVVDGEAELGQESKDALKAEKSKTDDIDIFASVDDKPVVLAAAFELLATEPIDTTKTEKDGTDGTIKELQIIELTPETISKPEDPTVVEKGLPKAVAEIVIASVDDKPSVVLAATPELLAAEPIDTMKTEKEGSDGTIKEQQSIELMPETIAKLEDTTLVEKGLTKAEEAVAEIAIASVDDKPSVVLATTPELLAAEPIDTIKTEKELADGTIKEQQFIELMPETIAKPEDTAVVEKGLPKAEEAAAEIAIAPIDDKPSVVLATTPKSLTAEPIDTTKTEKEGTDVTIKDQQSIELMLKTIAKPEDTTVVEEGLHKAEEAVTEIAIAPSADKISMVNGDMSDVELAAPSELISAEQEGMIRAEQILTLTTDESGPVDSEKMDEPKVQEVVIVETNKAEPGKEHQVIEMIEGASTTEPAEATLSNSLQNDKMFRALDDLFTEKEPVFVEIQSQSEIIQEETPSPGIAEVNSQSETTQQETTSPETTLQETMELDIAEKVPLMNDDKTYSESAANNIAVSVDVIHSTPETNSSPENAEVVLGTESEVRKGKKKKKSLKERLMFWKKTSEKKESATEDAAQGRPSTANKMTFRRKTSVSDSSSKEQKQTPSSPEQ